MPSAATQPPAPSDPGLQGVVVFISYPRGGASHGWAERVHADLAARGARVWRDEQRISEGDDDWYARIQQGLASAQVVACIVGADSEASRWQQREMLSADRLALPVVVFRTTPVALPTYVIEKQPVELRDAAAPQACLARLASALAAAWQQAATQPGVPQPLPGSAPAGLPAAQRQHELDYLNALLFGGLSDREARYQPLAGQERQGPSLARSHKGLRTELTVLFQAFHQPAQALHDQAPTPWADVLGAYRSLPGRRIRRLAVLGEPGAGKTFSLERIACHHARLALASTDAPLPLLVRLGQWTRETPLQAFIEGQLGALGPHFSALRDQGRAVQLLDGLNEIPPGQRQFKAAQMRQLAEDERFAAVVLSCRQTDYASDYSLPFDTLTLQPLTPPQVHRFLQRAYSLDKGAELGAALAEQRFWQIAGGEPLREVWTTWQQAGASFEQFWTDDDLPRGLKDVNAKPTWEKIQLWRAARHDQRALMRLAGNPYLLFVMTALPTLPRNRAALFDGFLGVLHGRERSAREARHDGRSVPESATWLAALAELAAALQRLQPAEALYPGDLQFGAATTLPRHDWPALVTSTLLAFSIDASVLQLLGDDLGFTHQLLQEALASRVLLQASAGGSPPAIRFWPAERWWQPSGWEVAAEIAAEACASDPPMLWQLLTWMARAQPEVACVAWRRAGAPVLPSDVAQAIRQHWLPLLTDVRAEPAAAARAAIGRALGAWGLDNRPGVGLHATGLPDIDWVGIPGGLPFIYQDGTRLVLPSFEIARFPITHRQYQAFIEAGGYSDERWWSGLAGRITEPENAAWTEPNAPRETVSWYEAVAFCRWLGATLGEDIRLPTEQQWERAARGRQGVEYPWGNGYHTGHANCNDRNDKFESGTPISRTTVVGIYPFPSPEGVLDLAGNVWEWCLNDLDNPENISTAGTASRPLRGGSWSVDPWLVRGAYRYGVYQPERRDFITGFRVCRIRPIHEQDATSFDTDPSAH